MSFFLCSFNQFENTVISILNIMLGLKSLKWAYLCPGVNVNILFFTNSLTRSLVSFSFFWTVCFPEGRTTHRSSSIIRSISSKKAIAPASRFAHFSFKFTPKWLISSFARQFHCSNRTSQDIFFPLPPLLLIVLFHLFSQWAKQLHLQVKEMLQFHIYDD